MVGSGGPEGAEILKTWQRLKPLSLSTGFGTPEGVP